MNANHCGECQKIEENCTYTAEAHHNVAKRQKSWYVGMQLVPAISTALLGSLTVGQVVPGWVGIVGLGTAIVTAIGTVMNPQQGYYEHLNAAKAFTVLKHDARAGYEAFGPTATDREGALLVKALHDRYNELVLLAPPTENWAFDKARERIKAGKHESDEKA